MGQYSAAAMELDVDGVGDVLSDERVWRAVERAAAALVARDAAPDHAHGGTRELASGSQRYQVSAVPVYDASAAGDPKVLVVAIEPLRSADACVFLLRRHFDLTRREAQVAVLLARRLSTEEVAETLGFTSHTAKRHTERILAKLGVERRTDVRHVVDTLYTAGGEAARRRPRWRGRTRRLSR